MAKSLRKAIMTRSKLRNKYNKSRAQKIGYFKKNKEVNALIF